METGEATMSSRDVTEYVDLPYWVAMQEQVTGGGRRVWFATHPELPGCDSDGETPDEAIANLRRARELFIRGMLRDGVPVPRPAEEWRHALREQRDSSPARPAAEAIMA